jgi:hypothetical protein
VYVCIVESSLPRALRKNRKKAPIVFAEAWGIQKWMMCASPNNCCTSVPVILEPCVCSHGWLPAYIHLLYGSHRERERERQKKTRLLPSFFFFFNFNALTVSNGEPFRLLIKSPVDFVVYKGIRATPQEEERPQIPKLTNSLLNQRLINKIQINPPPPP